MKKLFLALLVLVIIVFFVACRQAEDFPNEDITQQETTAQVETTTTTEATTQVTLEITTEETTQREETTTQTTTRNTTTTQREITVQTELIQRNAELIIEHVSFDYLELSVVEQVAEKLYELAIGEIETLDVRGNISEIPHDAIWVLHTVNTDGEIFRIAMAIDGIIFVSRGEAGEGTIIYQRQFPIVERH